MYLCYFTYKKRIQFKLSKQRKIDSLCSLLDTLSIPYTKAEATKSGLNILQPYVIRIYGEHAQNLISKLGEVKEIPFILLD